MAGTVLPRRKWAAPALVAVFGVAALIAGRAIASDHQDTPEVELNPRMDINDVYAFPGSSADRITLVLTTSSPISGQNASFDPNLLYQFKVDNTADNSEDLVIQVTFDGGTGSSQNVTVRGPAAPASKGTVNRLIDGGTVVSGAVGGTLGASPGMQVFTGLRADPFFIDLERFLEILPDRRPSTGPLSVPTNQTAQSFRNPGIDFLRPFNTLAIVVELPKAQLVTSSGADAKFGLWSTISR
ncbi:MAG: DUF4331 family protein [Gemmatimonadaceae bacterium]